MSGVFGEQCNELEFSYESDASSSFLVVRCKAEMIEYQVRMLENNDIGYIVPFEVVRKEGVSHIFCNITSKIPLSLYMRRYKFSVQEFLRLLLGISASISDSSGYLLTPSNFVLNAEYMYIDPETQNVMIVYIPAAISSDAAGSLQSFVSGLLMQHIHEEGFGSGNIVQRILSEVNSEMFNIRSFITLLNGLLYGSDEGVVSRSSGPEQNYCSKDFTNNGINDKIEENTADKEHNIRKSIISPVMIAVLLQFLMGGIIYMCRGLLHNAGENPAVTFAAVILIVLSIEVLIFKKLQDMKLINIRSAGGSRDNAETCAAEAAAEQVGQRGNTALSAVNKGKSVLHRLLGRDNSRKGGLSGNRNAEILNSAEDAIQNMSGMINQYEAASKAAGYANNAPPIGTEAAHEIIPRNNTMVSQKTEELGKIPKGAHILRHVSMLNGERDIVIDKDEFIIGRLDGHVDYVLHNNAVGKLHAELIRRNGTCYVRDLNSINGTYVNNQRIESNKEIELKDSDSLLFANSEFIFVAGQK